LSAKGKFPTGWHIKEILGRGKISSIQADLEQLIKNGKVSEEISELVKSNSQLTESLNRATENADMLHTE
jgi:hypothetical protein